jgi:type IV pilus assembly protein PilE
MKYQKGFTLIELMIVVVVIAILASIAIPSYQQYIVRSKLTEAVQNLAQVKTTMEQFYQDNGAYNTTPTATSTTCGFNAVAPAGKSFTLACTASATTFTGTLTGTGTLAGYTYTINQLGNKATTASPNGTNGTCWLIAGACS